MNGRKAHNADECSTAPRPLTPAQLDAVKRLVLADMERSAWTISANNNEREALSAHVDLLKAFDLPTRYSRLNEARGGFIAMWDMAFPRSRR